MHSSDKSKIHSVMYATCDMLDYSWKPNNRYIESFIDRISVITKPKMREMADLSFKITEMNSWAKLTKEDELNGN